MGAEKTRTSLENTSSEVLPSLNEVKEKDAQYFPAPPNEMIAPDAPVHFPSPPSNVMPPPPNMTENDVQSKTWNTERNTVISLHINYMI